MHIIFTQSRYQNILNRVYVAINNHIWAVLPMVVLPIFLSNDINWNSIKLSLFFGFIGICLISLWFFLFNRGETTITEYALEMTDEGISYTRYDSRKQIKWLDFDRFRVKNNFPRMILIKSKTGKTIEFSYYTFSAEQRREIFRTLRAMQGQSMS